MLEEETGPTTVHYKAKFAEKFHKATRDLQCSVCRLAKSACVRVLHQKKAYTRLTECTLCTEIEKWDLLMSHKFYLTFAVHTAGPPHVYRMYVCMMGPNTFSSVWLSSSSSRIGAREMCVSVESAREVTMTAAVLKAKSGDINGNDDIDRDFDSSSTSSVAIKNSFK